MIKANKKYKNLKYNKLQACFQTALIASAFGSNPELWLAGNFSSITCIL